MSEKPQTGPTIKMFASLLAKATENVEWATSKLTERKERDYEADARWYVAMNLAAEMREDYTTKDWAHFVLEGMQPLTDEDVHDFLIEGMPTDKEIRKWYGLG